MRKKKERMELLWKIKQQTKKCECKEYDEECSNCNEIKKLGEDLLNVTADCRKARGVEDFEDPKRRKVKMTINQYLKYKEQGLLDREIIKKKKLTKSILNRWKRENDLVVKTK